jgi:uncharacterized membrane protein YsdA (DUF1294 family)
MRLRQASLMVNLVLPLAAGAALHAYLGWRPALAWLLCVNLQLLALLAKDKLSARRHPSRDGRFAYRTPESTFFFLAAVGASPALLLGRWLLHHKTVKAEFIAKMVAIFLLQAVAVYWFWPLLLPWLGA